MLSNIFPICTSLAMAIDRLINDPSRRFTGALLGG
jgi:hypothetical protein